jgi:aryl-alcohol dehydrogenase-like predicted oxidoreductase
MLGDNILEAQEFLKYLVRNGIQYFGMSENSSENIRGGRNFTESRGIMQYK